MRRFFRPHKPFEEDSRAQVANLASKVVCPGIVTDKDSESSVLKAQGFFFLSQISGRFRRTSESRGGNLERDAWLGLRTCFARASDRRETFNVFQDIFVLPFWTLAVLHYTTGTLAIVIRFCIH